MVLSILIAGLEKRLPLLNKLHSHIFNQIYALNKLGNIEILLNIDNKEQTTGAKRNELLIRAKGKYIVFIDDDDWVSDWYVEEILAAAESDADCFAISGLYTVDGKNPIEWRISKYYENETLWENKKPVYLRKTNHITPVKRILALINGFPDKSNAEDKWYSDNLNPLLKSEYKIEKPMYHYRDTLNPKEYV